MCVYVCMCVCRSFEKMRLSGIVFVLFRFLLFCLFVVVRDFFFFFSSNFNSIILRAI